MHATSELSEVACMQLRNFPKLHVCNFGTAAFLHVVLLLLFYRRRIRVNVAGSHGVSRSESDSQARGWEPNSAAATYKVTHSQRGLAAMVSAKVLHGSANLARSRGSLKKTLASQREDEEGDDLHQLKPRDPLAGHLRSW